MFDNANAPQNLSLNQQQFIVKEHKQPFRGVLKINLPGCRRTVYDGNSSVKWGHLGHFDLEPNKHDFPTNPMGSSGTHWARIYNNNYKNQNKN